MGGVNLVGREGDESRLLCAWYSGPTLVDYLGKRPERASTDMAIHTDITDTLEPPQRNIEAPLRIPLSNVFRGQTGMSHGVGVSGRIVSGVVQVGERLRVVPGDETCIIRCTHAFSLGSRVSLMTLSSD